MMKHLISCKDLTLEHIESIFLLSSELKKNKGAQSQRLLRSLKDQLVALLFVEPSTRTRLSFEIASFHHGAKTVLLSEAQSSLTKGESLEDTARNLSSLGCKVCIIRHPKSHALEPLVKLPNLDMSFINAGDGTNEHPSQALLDVFSMLEHHSTLKGLKIAILGDILRSRVARSNMILLSKLGAHVFAAGPDSLMPEKIDIPNVTLAKNGDEASDQADIVMALRIQKERTLESINFDTDNYLSLYGLSKARYALAKKNALIMHPGPIQRDVEIDSDLADDPRSIILKQVENGVYVRMAILEFLGKLK